MNHHASGNRVVASLIIAAPRGRAALDAHAEERQRRLEQDVGRDQQGGVDDQRREEVRQDLAHDDPPVRGAQRAGRLDELLLAQGQDLAAHDARDVGPVDDRDDHDDDGEAGLDEAVEAALRAGAGRRQAEAEEQDREGQHHVDGARQQRVDPAAVEAGQQADDRADEDGDAGRDQGHLERDAGAVDRAREDVAAEAVDAERMLGGRAGRRAEDVERLRALHARAGRAGDLDDQRREDRDEDQQHDEARARPWRPCPGGGGARTAASATGRRSCLARLLLRRRRWRRRRRRGSSPAGSPVLTSAPPRSCVRAMMM